MYPQAKEQIECGHVVKEESVVIQSKEKEMLEHLLKQGLPVSEAKKKVKITLDC